MYTALFSKMRVVHDVYLHLVLYLSIVRMFDHGIKRNNIAQSGGWLGLCCGIFIRCNLALQTSPSLLTSSTINDNRFDISRMVKKNNQS